MTSTSKFFLKRIPLLLVLFATIYACEENAVNPGAESPKSALQIRMTDNPDDYDQVNIDLQQVEVKYRDSSGFRSVNTYPGIYDLLQLQNGLDTVIVFDSIAVGELQQVRLILGPENTIMVDSVIHPMATPSAQQSGLKINLNRLMNQDSLNVVLLDFDAAESVVERGNGTYSLKPVIKVME